MTIVLTAIRNGDEQTLFEWINNRALVVNSSSFAPVHWSSHRDWLERVTKDPTMRIFAIRDANNDQLIGTCQLHSINPLTRSAELQIRIGPTEARGKGVGTDAVSALVRFGYDDLNLHRIYLYVFAKNEAARRCYDRVGFREEGVLRDAGFINGGYCDVVMMSLLQPEWAPPLTTRSC